jgi:ATP-dependent Lon protease
MLDEIDKLGFDFRGDPSSALLEALDPEQNSNFSDHYLEVPFDLSDVLFITTANVLENIPPALRDRMEVIEFSGYTVEEKLLIAKLFIWPKISKSHGLQNDLEIDDKGIIEVINLYTQEACVRGLERELAKIARKIALLSAQKKPFDKKITDQDIRIYLGQPKRTDWKKEIEDVVGAVAALAVTEGGGEVLSVEASFIPGGKGNLTLTGHLGNIMKESAEAALSYTRTKAKIFHKREDFFSIHDVHVHVPMGAIPKDGPSAGIAIASALISSLSGRKIDPEVGMTGEITLRGRVLGIGGVREKVLAARRVGLRKIILPEANKGDLGEIENNYKKDLKFFLVKTIDDALPVIFKQS